MSADARRGRDRRRSGRPIEPGPREEVEEEFAFHLEMRTHQYIEAGLTPEEAARRAHAGFGDLHRVKETCRHMARERDRARSRAEGLQRVSQDVRYGLRQLRGAPTFTCVAVLTLALGIGATTAMFSAVEAVLLRPPPYPAPDRLVVPKSRSIDSGETWEVSYADYLDWREAGTFEHAAVYQPWATNLGAEGREAERVTALHVTDDFFATLGATPLRGRFPGGPAYADGAPSVAVISFGLWRRWFGGADDAVGSEILLAGRPAEVVAVLPPDLAFPSDADVWIPLRHTPESLEIDMRRDQFVYGAIARLAPGRELADTRAELAAMAARVAEDDPAAREGVSVTAIPLERWLVGADLSRALWLLLGAVGLVLLIGCVNVANLLLSRATTRERELAVRTALGASRARLVRQLLTESVVLALLGGLAGVGLAYAGARALIALAPPSLPRMAEAGVAPGVLVFALAVSVASAILFGLVPALATSSRDPRGALADGTTRGSAGVGGRRQRRILVAAELSLSMVLVVGAGLVLRSLGALRATDPGFDTRARLAFSLSMQGDRYRDRAARLPALEEVREALAASSGTESVDYVSSLPLGGGGFYLGRALLPEGAPEPPAGEDLNALWTVVSPGYFETMAIPFVAGRGFERSDGAGSEPVAIASRSFAERMFRGRAVVGRRVRSWRDEDVYRRIVGVVEDVRIMGAGDSLRPVLYVPYAQDSWGSVVFVVRAAGDPAALAPFAREAVRRLDPTLAIDDVRTLRAVWDQSIAPRRFGAVLLAGFAALALLLALIGVFGLLSHAVSQRRREIGIRVAFGAGRSDVTRLVLSEAGRVVGGGLIVGLVAALVLVRFARSLLYGVGATDPATFGTATALLGLTAFLASWLPARRAARLDPSEALRD